MNDNLASEPCAHKSCACRIDAGQTYCGPHCANASVQAQPEQTEMECACGHAQCTERRHAPLRT